MNIKSNSLFLNKAIVFVAVVFIGLCSCIISCQRLFNVPPSPSVRWPHEKSNLVPDPSVTYGRFANGFRYVLLKNKEPKDRVSMHLNVQAGSLNETDEQKGIAHFLEHMLFRGTTHFPPGELIKYFQNIGMQFGADANAYTGFYETVYDVLLPSGDGESLEKGLLVLQDYAEGALLLPREIDQERNVVLAEKRERDSASYRTFVSTLNFELPNTRLAKRLPIGSETVIRGADRKLLKDFYDTWYRPEKMTVVVVGDFDKDKIIPIIERKFSHLVSRAPPVKDPDVGQFDHKGEQVFYHFEKEMGKATVSIEVVKKIDPENDSKAYRIRRMKKNLADRMVEHRLNMLLRETNAPFTSASIRSGEYLREIEYAEISATCNSINWSKTLVAIEKTLRQALMYGFMEEEFERVKQDYISSLEDAVEKSETRNSRQLKRQIINSMNANRVFLSPKQKRNLLMPTIKRLRLKEVTEAFKENWEDDHRLILVTGNADLKDADTSPRSRIMKTYQQSKAVEVPRPSAWKPVSFPYLPVPEKKGGIVHRKNHTDLGIIQIDFENGVRLNVKKTGFKNDEILGIVAFGTGRSGEPKHLQGISALSQGVINESALGALNREELSRALTGKRTEVEFRIDESSFKLEGDTVPEEVELLFQLFHAYMMDVAYREDAYTLVMDRYRQYYRSMSHTIDGAMRLYVNRFFAGGDSRFGLPPYNEFKELTLDDVRMFTKDAFASAPLEISIVGDIDIDKIIELAAIYMGNLPARKGYKSSVRSALPTFPVSKRLDVGVDTEISKGRVIVAYPTEDIWNIRRTRRFAVLGDVFSERMRVKIREALGASYSAYAYNRPSRAYPGYGMFLMVVNIDPVASESIVKEVMAIADDISEKGIHQDDLKRALKPTLTSIKDLKRENDYWLNTVLNGSLDHPEQIEWSRTIMDDYGKITSDELTALSRKYIDNDKAAIVVIKPET